MAKGIGLFGNWRGKVGNTIGYALKGSNNKQTQGIRIYQPVVSNPNTVGQVEQRVDIKSAMRMYSAVKSIADHSFEGYSGKANNMRRFLSLNVAALKSAPADFAFATRDNATAVWGPIVLSAGSLAVPFTFGQDTNASSTTLGQFGAIAPLPSSVTAETLTAEVVAQALGLVREGMWVTVCFLTASKVTFDTGQPVSTEFRVLRIRRPASADLATVVTASNFAQLFGADGLAPVFGAVLTGSNGFQIFIGAQGEGSFNPTNTLAVGAILSEKSGSDYLRSSCTMAAYDTGSETSTIGNRDKAVASYAPNEEPILNGGSL